METSRDDFGIAIRSAFLRKGTQQRFSLVALVIISIILLFVEKIETKPLNILRSLIKDTVYRSSVVVTSPFRFVSDGYKAVGNHLNIYKNYKVIKKENDQLKNKFVNSEYLILENTQLRKLIDEQVKSSNNLLSARVMIDKKSPYLNSFIINIGSNKGVKNGMTALDGNYFVGRIVDVNFFSSRVLLVSDLNSKIPVIIEPSANHAILSGKGNTNPTLKYLAENHSIKDGDTVYTSGKEGVFSSGVPIGKVKIKANQNNVVLFSDLNQITFVNVNLGDRN